MWEFQLIFALNNTCYGLSFYFGRSNRYVVRFCCGLVCIFLMTNQAECWVSFYVFIYRPYVSFGEVSVQIFSYFLEKQVGWWGEKNWKSPWFSPDPRGGKRELMGLLLSFLWLPGSESGIESRDKALLWPCVSRHGTREGEALGAC